MADSLPMRTVNARKGSVRLLHQVIQIIPAGKVQYAQTAVSFVTLSESGIRLLTSPNGCEKNMRKTVLGNGNVDRKTFLWKVPSRDATITTFPSLAAFSQNWERSG